jgi:hypothetical protein
MSSSTPKKSCVSILDISTTSQSKAERRGEERRGEERRGEV